MASQVVKYYKDDQLILETTHMVLPRVGESVTVDGYENKGSISSKLKVESVNWTIFSNNPKNHYVRINLV
jgi:hypothetical protein